MKAARIKIGCLKSRPSDLQYKHEAPASEFSDYGLTALQEISMVGDGFQPGPTEDVRPKGTCLLLELAINLQKSDSNLAATCRLVFEKQSDRWGHRLVFDDGKMQTDLLISVEGDSEQDWPPSPPLQDVSLEDLGSTTAIMGVGMAGKSHWSASYSIEDNHFKADIACLQKEVLEIAELVSSYRLGEEVEFVETEPNFVRLKISGNRSVPRNGLKISPLSLAANETEVTCNDRQLLIAPKQISKNKKQATRWGFLIAPG